MHRKKLSMTGKRSLMTSCSEIVKIRRFFQGVDAPGGVDNSNRTDVANELRTQNLLQDAHKY